VAREEIADRRWHELGVMAPGRDAWAVFQGAVQGAEPVRLPEVHRTVGADETVWDCSLIPIATRRGDETIEYVLVSAVEVTDQVRAREELERLDHLKDEFLSLASHELRTPLVPLTAYSELLARLAGERDKSEGWERRFADIVAKLQRQLGHLGRMTDDLLDVGRLQSGKLKLEGRTLDLTTLVPAVADQAGDVQPGRTVRVENRGVETLPVSGDEGRLTQVLLNLLENSFKYATGEEVVVRLSQVQDTDRPLAQIEVEDRGPGIPVGERPSLFTRFFQGAREVRPARSGLGLGLYIARGIVEQHGGTIELDPSWEEGTRVRIRLPLATG
jgi:signal transduction histidine kinase